MRADSNPATRPNACNKEDRVGTQNPKHQAVEETQNVVTKKSREQRHDSTCAKQRNGASIVATPFSYDGQRETEAGELDKRQSYSRQGKPKEPGIQQTWYLIEKGLRSPLPKIARPEDHSPQHGLNKRPADDNPIAQHVHDVWTSLISACHGPAIGYHCCKRL